MPRSLNSLTLCSIFLSFFFFFFQHISHGISGSSFKFLLLFKAVFLSSFPAVYSELLKLFDVREVANLVQDTLGSLPTILHVDDSLQAIKLQCIGKTVESQLYTNPGRVLSLLEEILPLKSHFVHCSHWSADAIKNKKLKGTFSKPLFIWVVNVFSSQIQKYGN